MKPTWDRLVGDFKGSSTSLVADVDCDGEGKDLCTTHGIEGFPTIKYGDPADLKAYEGGRDYAELKKFADENLGPQCGPDYMDLCDAKTKDKIIKFQAMSTDDLAAKKEKTLALLNEDVPLMRKALSWVHMKNPSASSFTQPR